MSLKINRLWARNSDFRGLIRLLGQVKGQFKNTAFLRVFLKQAF